MGPDFISYHMVAFFSSLIMMFECYVRKKKVMGSIKDANFFFLGIRFSILSFVSLSAHWHIMNICVFSIRLYRCLPFLILKILLRGGFRIM